VNKDAVRSCDLKKRIKRGDASKENPIKEKVKEDKLLKLAKTLFMEFKITKIVVDTSKSKKD
jgi:hypothetical protein